MLVASDSFKRVMTSQLPKEVYLKLEFYDREMNFINEITKFVSISDAANISIDRTRSIRRSFSFALDNSSDENLFSWGEENLIWIDKRVKVYIGLKLPSGEVEYVLQGTFVCSDIRETSDSAGKKTYITGQDKSYLLTEPFGKIDGIYKELVGEDLTMYPVGESPTEIKALLQTHVAIPFANRLLNPGDFPLPTITELTALGGGQPISPVADPELIEYFSNRFVTHQLAITKSPTGTAGEDPYRVYPQVYLDGGVYKIIFDEDAAKASAQTRGDFIDFPNYYAATIFMIHCYTREYFQYYANQSITISAMGSHLRPQTTSRITDIIKNLLIRAGETEPLLADDLPQYEGDPSQIKVGTDILTRDLEYSEGSSFISIIEELAEMVKCEFYYNTFGIPVLRRVDLNNFSNSSVVARYGDGEAEKHLYVGNERKLNIETLANQIHVYGGGAKDRTIIYRLKVTNSDPLFANSPFSVEKIGRIIYAHNGGEPDPVISTVKEAIYRAVYELKNRLGYSEELPIRVLPNYLLEPSDIIEVIDSRSGISDRYMIEKLDIPINPGEVTLICKKEIRAIGDNIDDWENIQATLISRYENGGI